MSRVLYTAGSQVSDDFRSSNWGLGSWHSGMALQFELRLRSLYDADSILRSTSILLDDLQIAAGTREFGTLDLLSDIGSALC